MPLLHMQKNLATEYTIFTKNRCDFNYLSNYLSINSYYYIKKIEKLIHFPKMSKIY